ncbi:MAG: phage tail sheath protein [Ruminococcaceae bacterium]|nr:phage tail sheath protein [Oscillospiraceae bacterium]
MGLPDINISFRNAATTVVRRASRGVVAVILLDSAAGTAGVHNMTGDTQIPAGLSAVNKDYLAKVFIGYVNQPSKVIAYVLGTSAEDFSTALAYFATQKINYVVGPPDCTAAQAAEIIAWVKAQRADKRTTKAVVPDVSADNKGIINFTTDEIKVGSNVYSTAAYCGRMAGLIAGTPIKISCTYAPLPEVLDVKRLDGTAMDAAVDAGQLIIFHDGEKVKVGRGVNSLTTLTETENESFQKIKIVEAIDMIQDDVRMQIQDNYTGKYSNSYDHKCILITAIGEYLKQLEQDDVVQKDSSSVGLDIDRQRDYLESKSIDTSKMSEQEIKNADTGAKVFLSGKAKILDTIEDVDLDFSI